jgi:hypothetical protein
MATKLTIEYDAVGDILYLDVVKPSEDHVLVEVSPGAMLRKNTHTGAVEGIEVAGFRRRLGAPEGIEVPVGIQLQMLDPISS